MKARRVVTVVPDLFFLTRIRAVAAQVGALLEDCVPGAALAGILAAPPDLVILDLHAEGEPLALVRALKTDPRTAGVPVVGFYSHVDGETRRASLEAGVDHVMPRSAFTTRLADLLTGAG
ncbi:MAG: hypothetical protein HYR73_04945 [Candidatus Eisenbacteria bacterium]|nr:hypothetical protein [Candidatus Eisenbacteria bacterium]